MTTLARRARRTQAGARPVAAGPRFSRSAAEPLAEQFVRYGPVYHVEPLGKIERRLQPARLRRRIDDHRRPRIVEAGIDVLALWRLCADAPDTLLRQGAALFGHKTPDCCSCPETPPVWAPLRRGTSHAHVRLRVSRSVAFVTPRDPSPWCALSAPAAWLSWRAVAFPFRVLASRLPQPRPA